MENSWHLAAEDYHGQQRYRGRLVVAEPMGFLLKLHDDEGYGYSKVPASPTPEHDVDCLLQSLPLGKTRVILRLDHTVNTLGRWNPRSVIITPQGTFLENSPFALAHFADGSPAITILAIAATKLRHLRNRIWRVKTAYLASIPESNKIILWRTRHGYVRTMTS